jgi:hypothetical protein
MFQNLANVKSAQNHFLKKKTISTSFQKAKFANMSVRFSQQIILIYNYCCKSTPKDIKKHLVSFSAAKAPLQEDSRAKTPPNYYKWRGNFEKTGLYWYDCRRQMHFERKRFQA